jgi:hypothetical protein
MQDRLALMVLAVVARVQAQELRLVLTFLSNLLTAEAVAEVVLTVPLAQEALIFLQAVGVALLVVHHQIAVALAVPELALVVVAEVLELET